MNMFALKAILIPYDGIDYCMFCTLIHRCIWSSVRGNEQRQYVALTSNYLLQTNTYLLLIIDCIEGSAVMIPVMLLAMAT